MKKHLLKLVFIVSILSFSILTSCNTVTNKNNNLQSNKLTHEESATNKIKPMDKKDFSVTNGTDTIYLDMLYKDSLVNGKEKKLSTNLVNESISGDYLYKYYFHQYNDFTIYDSNENYNLKNRSMDDYYIFQIALNNSNCKTYRGVYIGQTLSDVVKAYGNENKTVTNGTTSVFYRFKKMKLSFTLNKTNKINGIDLDNMA